MASRPPRNLGHGSWRNEDRGVALQRSQAVRTLAMACADGRLTLEDLIRRTEAAQTARTHEDLQRVTDALPALCGATVSGPRRGARRLLVGFLGLSGRWPLPALRPRVLAIAAFGEVAIDLARTPVTSFRTEITAVALAGEVRIVVPPGMRVERKGKYVVLGYTVLPGAGPSGALVPALRLKIVALLGDVRVTQADT